MGITVYSLLWVMQGLDHQPQDPTSSLFRKAQEIDSGSQKESSEMQRAEELQVSSLGFRAKLQGFR